MENLADEDFNPTAAVDPIDEILSGLYEAPPSTELDPVLNARRLGWRFKLRSKFKSEEAVEACLNRFGENTRAVLKVCLGIPGPISWATSKLPWTTPERMERRLDQECLWTPTAFKSYSVQEVAGFEEVRGVSVHRLNSFEYDVGRFLQDLKDPSVPFTLQARFFELTTEQVKAAIETFFNPPPVLLVPPARPVSASLRARVF